jgi:predicted RNA-binding Zn-ribbon protein involved in translation (DUF1610 family)
MAGRLFAWRIAANENKEGGTKMKCCETEMEMHDWIIMGAACKKFSCPKCGKWLIGGQDKPATANMLSKIMFGV